MVYKIAAEIGSLGDNIRFLRSQIKNDRILQIIAAAPHTFHTVSSHTRWASVGAITEPNCHPVDNKLDNGDVALNGIIHTCLNGDIDNCFGPKPERTSKYAPGQELSFQEGNGNARIDVSTMNGDISICR